MTVKKQKICKRGHILSKTRRIAPSGSMYCIECVKIRSNETRLNSPKKAKLWARKTRLKARYGLSLPEFNTIKTKQKNKCAICKKSLKTNFDTVVDHCHHKNTVRGILCQKCNLGIGHLNDSIRIVKEALKYLQKHTGIK